MAEQVYLAFTIALLCIQFESAITNQRLNKKSLVTGL